jgi:hypothetical protein
LIPASTLAATAIASNVHFCSSVSQKCFTGLPQRLFLSILPLLAAVPTLTLKHDDGAEIGAKSSDA